MIFCAFRRFKRDSVYRFHTIIITYFILCFGADSGNQTRTLTLARLRTITMQYPHCWSGRSRSCDIRINSSALYQLSYRPKTMTYLFLFYQNSCSAKLQQLCLLLLLCLPGKVMNYLFLMLESKILRYDQELHHIHIPTLH